MPRDAGLVDVDRVNDVVDSAQYIFIAVNSSSPILGFACRARIDPGPKRVRREPGFGTGSAQRETAGRDAGRLPHAISRSL
jgi:hypothetical protein